ncbi:hypothetical protein [Burkholderia sp. Bp9004]|uniref:hypothetical protein n=1 Tax=Burkholderia sp. Bp9004 TaxID=2184559 RepID=UPI000F5E9299|nr:hypothetical protein [Burkholderia sp. Bp9004]
MTTKALVGPGRLDQFDEAFDARCGRFPQRPARSAECDRMVSIILTGTMPTSILKGLAHPGSAACERSPPRDASGLVQ